MSKHRAIAQGKMAEARRLCAFALRHMRTGCASFHAMHQQDFKRAKDRFAAYWLASDCSPPRSLFGNY